ncbi:MAG TPA: hypothetical protein VEQ40_01050 [Pyrinomonadaceae bacterium]|nr:hypothetical protein [Pyrinomonadaceae bacterium]
MKDEENSSAFIAHSFNSQPPPLRVMKIRGAQGCNYRPATGKSKDEKETMKDERSGDEV